MNMLRRESVFEDVIGLAKSLLDISYAPRVVGVNIIDGARELGQT
jgi:hypothetical protein